MLTKRELLRSGALTAITVATTKSFPASAQTSADRPGFFKAKDIAEAGFIYGLPIVMNYGVMYEYAVDRNSGQYKAPFNRSLTFPTSHPQGHRRPMNSDTLFTLWVDLRAEPMVVSVRRRPQALLLGELSTAIPITTAISVAVPRSRLAIT